MSSETHSAKFVRFGIYEADLSTGELRKNGARVRLQEQPFQLLAYLLSRKGTVVTREELREKLWPADTFVDFDHSLNTAVNKVREALGDSATSPRFVETLAKRGYRFIAPVEWVNGTGASRTAAKNSEALPGQLETPIDPALGVPAPHRGLVRIMFALIQMMYLVFYVVALVRLPEVHAAASMFLPGWAAFAIQAAVLVTAAAGIPLRLYLLSAVGFDYSRLGRSFRKLFLSLLIFDQLWAMAPFLLTPQIGIGGAFAATAALLYVPFSQRTLVRMAYGSEKLAQ